MTLDTQDTHATRVDMHCHSTASQISKLGVQRAVGLPECATPPEEVYALAKRRGMDFVTITDHDTIDGVLQIADRPDVFVSEELTAHFRGEPQAVHVLCYGLSPDDHDWLQAHSGDVELCAAHLHEREIACALAHPYYAVGAPLHSRHRRRLAELFPVWETRNGARARELNLPAATYVATRDSVGIGGSDDHAGSSTSGAPSPKRLPPPRPRSSSTTCAPGRHRPRKQGSAAKWAHAAIALAARSLMPAGDAREQTARPDPRRVLNMVQRLLREGDARHGTNPVDGSLSPADARCLLRAWLSAVELDHLDERGLIALMQAEDFSHSGLYRRACRLHERKLNPPSSSPCASPAARVRCRPPPRVYSRAASPRSPTRPPRPFSPTSAPSSTIAPPTTTASSRAWRSSPTASARCTASRARSKRSASAASPASRSRSSPPTPTSTGACPR